MPIRLLPRCSISLLACAAFVGCSSADSESVSVAPSATNSGTTKSDHAVVSEGQDIDAVDPNPLGFAPRPISLEVGQRIFVVPGRMLRGMKVGSSAQLRLATVAGVDGESILVDGRDEPAYKAHPAFAIPVPEGKRPKVGGPTIADWAGQLRHGVFVKIVKEQPVIRFTDTPDKSERTLKNPALIPQIDGFRPGNYAAVASTDLSGVGPRGAEYKHVLLVSEVSSDPKKWLALGFGGSITIVDEAALIAIPVRYEPKEGAPVFAEWLGSLRPATIKALDSPGVFTVRYERAGKAVNLGWGFVLPPVGRMSSPKP
jgi:hypothetical protein